jgi:rsbT antagonist protein RsbS
VASKKPSDSSAIKSFSSRTCPCRYASAGRPNVEVPILKLGHNLIASIQSALTDADLSQLREALVEQVGRFRTRGVIVDVTAVDVIDSFAARTLRDLARATRLRGAETVIVGMQPEVAFTMVRLGLTFKGVATALDLEEGLLYLEQRAKGRPDGG